MPPAARKTDAHTCPIHGGGPIMTPCEETVIIGNKPAARVTDLCICAGAPSDPIAMGSPTVIIGNQMAARIGDPTGHGGVIVQGEPTVLIGVSGQGSALKSAAQSGQAYVEKG